MMGTRVRWVFRWGIGGLLLLLLCLSTTSWSDEPARGVIYGPESYAEDTPVGPYGQPQWTLDRKWASPEGTRVYVLPAWEFQGTTGVQWSHEQQTTLLQEVELGLPYRFQVDCEVKGSNPAEPDGSWGYESTAAELRWALADWGRLWGNPTVKVEYTNRNAAQTEEPTAIEGRLQLGDSFHGIAWGVNGWYEKAIHATDHDLSLSAAVSKPIFQSKLGVGLEAIGTRTEDPDGTRWHGQIGPDVFARPIGEHITFTTSVLAGLGSADAPDVEVIALVAYRFGAESAEALTPTVERVR